MKVGGPSRCSCVSRPVHLQPLSGGGLREEARPDRKLHRGVKVLEIAGKIPLDSIGLILLPFHTFG